VLDKGICGLGEKVSPLSWKHALGQFSALWPFHAVFASVPQTAEMGFQQHCHYPYPDKKGRWQVAQN